VSDRVPRYARHDCYECGRVFDLRDAEDGAEWATGHDCDPDLLELIHHEPATRHPLQYAVPLELGRVVATPAAQAQLEADPAQVLRDSAAELLQRHELHDWGTLDEHDREQNLRALVEGLRVMSVYPDEVAGGPLWIITEADRSSTCILQPGDY